ncbi:MAG: hypothetical protein JW932_18415 [Deltaproteobacteria bacterium]|nr:hypothetical protein [Deltaproteobacteria bacterium]
MDELSLKVHELEREGWTKKFIADEPRLSEAVDLYKESGYEVHLEPLPGQNRNESCAIDGGKGECRICYTGSEERYKIIFTRPISSESELQDSSS